MNYDVEVAVVLRLICRILHILQFLDLGIVNLMKRIIQIPN